jgi:presenilin-like A22 family membrane protease
MSFDVVLPTVITLVTVVIVLLYQKFETRMASLFEEKEFQIRDVVFLVITMGIMVTIIVFVPQQAIQVLFLAAYSFVLFLFAYTAAEKWYLAVVPPAIFIALYLYFWNIWLLNIFAIVFAISVSIYLGGLFSWRTVLVFAGLITVMDVIQVFGTGFMGEAAGKAVALQLPVLVQVPTFPREGGIGLGLGDIFLGGLLSIQAMQKYDRKAGLVSALLLGLAFFVFEMLLFYYEFARFFPATLVVVAGWLLGLGVYRFARRADGS